MDSIPLNCGGLKEKLLALLKDIWKSEQMRKDWKEELVISLYKKEMQITAKY
jgi:hypothetical protein